MLTEHEREIAERARRILEEAAKVPAMEHFEDMVRRGVIDQQGRLIRNGASPAHQAPAKNGSASNPPVRDQ